MHHWPQLCPLHLLVMGHLGPVTEPLLASFLVCKMSLQDKLRIRVKNRKGAAASHRLSAQSMAPTVPIPSTRKRRSLGWDVRSYAALDKSQPLGLNSQAFCKVSSILKSSEISRVELLKTLSLAKLSFKAHLLQESLPGHIRL